MRPVHIDGFLFVGMAFFGSCVLILATDNAAKYIDPRTLWIAQSACYAVSQTMLAVKAFRSLTYGQDRKENGKTPVDVPKKESS